MEVSVKDAGPLRKQVTIHYPTNEVTAREDELLSRYSGQVKMKGFRSGKTPKSVVRKRFGKVVTSEAQEALAQEGLQEALREHRLEPIGPVSTDERSTDDGLRLVTSFDVRPPIELPEPAELELPSEDTSASDEAVEEELQSLARRAGTHDDLGQDAGFEKDDVLTLSGSITSGEETVREIQDLHHMLGSYPLFGKEPEEVLELVGGKQVGDELRFDSELPDGFQPPEWAGKQATISVTIQQAQRLKPAEIDDEFAKRVGAENVEQLRERVQGMIEQRKQGELHRQRSEALVDQLIERCSFELPPRLLDDLVENRVRELKRPDQSADDTDAQAEQAGADDEAVQEQAREEMERTLRRHLLLDSIASAYDVQATQQDLQQQITMAAYQSGRKPEEIAKQLQESGQMAEVASDIRQHKALELMLQKVLEAHGQGDSEDAAAGEQAADTEAEPADTDDQQAEANKE